MIAQERPFDRARRKIVVARLEFIGQLAKFSRDELSKVPAEGEWSPLELAHHLYVADGLALEQMRLVQEEDNPLIAPVEEEAPRRTRASAPPASLESVMAGMAARREEIFEYLSQLPDEAWERPFHHHLWGQGKFYQLVNVLPRHDQQHARQLVDIREKV